MDGSLRNHFLIAMPGLKDSIFTGSVTYICEHNEQGAMGLVINHPLDISIDDILDQLDLVDSERPHPEKVLAGGPVHMDRGFVLHPMRKADHWRASMAVSPDVCLTSSQDIIKAIARNEGPDEKVIALGYAGWSAGQLESELSANAWLTCPADEEIIFRLPYEQRAQAAAAKLGIDLNLISTEHGNA
jgi:putative transcriptional regulator